MRNDAKYEVHLMVNELKSIINELYSISNGVNKDFKGIGNELCANRINEVARHYEGVVKKLNKIDYSILFDDVTEE